MKTIEERATKKAIKFIHLAPFSQPTTRELLIEMATEQRDIDAEKAVKVHCKLCGNKFDYCDVCSEPDKIRQYMKEDQK